MLLRPAALGLTLSLTVLASLLSASPAHAAVSSTVISQATYPLGLDVDAAGNVWVGYSNGPMIPKGVVVVPAATGTLFGVAVTAGVETRIFDMDGIQGILRSPMGHLFVATDAGDLYVATETNSTVFGVATTANTLTLLSNADHFRGGLAMDSAGNLFGGRKDWNGVAVLPVSTGLLYGVNVVANTSSVLVATPDWSGDVAIDSQDNLYVASWFSGAPGIHVLPKATGTLYGQAVTQDTMLRLVAAANTAGVDIDSADNIYFSRWSANEIVVLTPVARTVLGQNFSANTPAILIGAPALEGLAVAADSSFVISGAGRTRRVVAISAPTITSLSPNSGAPSGGGSVTITGTDLTGTTSVTFGENPASNLVVVNATTVTVTPPPGVGAVTVQLTTHGGTATATNAFTYVSPAPRVPPGPPLGLVVVPLLEGATVTWSPPEDPGTDTINLYAVRAWPGGPVCQVPGATLSCTVAGLDPQQSYYFTVVPMSGAGWGTASQPSNSIQPLAPEPPGAPTNPVATAGNAQATVSWTAPSQVGSTPIREYRVTSSPAGGSCVAAAPTCTVTGLVNGTAYTFSVEARNDQGWGPASQSSAAVTPRAPAISIQGDRSGRIVSINGTTVGMSVGTSVEVWIRLGDSGSFARGASMVTVDPAGAINWSRRVNPDKQVAVYVMADGVQSNTVALTGTLSR